MTNHEGRLTDPNRYVRKTYNTGSITLPDDSVLIGEDYKAWERENGPTLATRMNDAIDGQLRKMWQGMDMDAARSAREAVLRREETALKLAAIIHTSQSRRTILNTNLQSTTSIEYALLAQDYAK